MPHALNLTDGTTTLSLTTGNCILGHYVPVAPRGAGEPVTEPVELTFTAPTTSQMQSAVNEVERMCEKARRRAELGVGPRVFVQFQPIGDGTLWRAELLDGRVEAGPSALQVWGNAKMGARLYLTRVPFWEGSRTQIPLSNGNGSANTSGLTIWNHDDSGAGNDNWVDIASSNVIGALPAPLELQFTNITGSNQNYRNFIVANNIFDSTLSHILEGEARQAGYGTVVTASGNSNGQYLSLSGAAGFVSSVWTIPTAVLQKTAGRQMHLLTAFQYFDDTANIRVRPEIRDQYGLVTLARGTDMVLGDAFAIQDLGVLPVPPGGYSVGWAAQTLVLNFYFSGAQTINLDFMQWTPADPLCYQTIAQRGMTVLNNSTVVVDGIEGVTYLNEAGVNHPIYAPKGPPVHVFPGVATQRLYILHDGYGRSVDWKLTMKAFYRPRRLTV